MKFAIASILAGALACGTAATAFAQDDPKGRINKRQENQQKRIEKGVEDGSLTKKEVVKIEAKEAALAAKEARDRKDGGGLTNKEKVRIERRQDKLSKDIAKERRDKQTRK